MKKYNINGHIIASRLNSWELGHRVAKSSALIKTMCGIGNNAAWTCCLEAMDHLRRHPNFRHKVKQGFNAAIEEFNAYERRLVYATENRLFHLDDLTPEYRKRYGNITDRDYYEYWCNTGATAYVQKRVWVVNVWNKYRLSLIRHKVPNEEEVAWGMAACACLRLAQYIYEQNIKVCANDHEVPAQLLEVIFGGLNVKAIVDKWDKALMLLEPKTEGYELEDIEAKNIQLGLDQLMEQWTSTATMTDALAEATEAHEDVFRTKGEQKKALRKIAEMREA